MGLYECMGGDLSSALIFIDEASLLDPVISHMIDLTLQ